MLKILKTALSKKNKPIMTKGKHDNLFNFKLNRRVNILDRLSDRNKKRIGEWLDSVEVKENVHGEPYISSPFWGSIYIYKDASYATLYKWCAVNFDTTRLAKLPKPLDIIIYYMIMKLCIDIYNTILCMREPRETKITNAMIDKVKFNMYLLKYYKEIFSRVSFEYFLTYIENHQKDNVILKEYILSVLTKHKESIPLIYKAIYDSIMYYIGDEDYMEDEKPSSNVFETLLSIYETILKLYKDNKKNTIYKPIKEPYIVDKGIEPQIPLNQQLPPDLQRYKMRLNNLQNASNERELKEFEEANVSNKKRLKELDDEKIKKYVFKKDVYERIYEGKYSPKQRKELLSLNVYKMLKKEEQLLRKTKSYGSVGKNHRENFDNLKAFTTISDKKNNKHGNNGINGNNSNSSSYKEIEGYYKNDIDPYTREEFSEMTPKKQKYASDIIYKNGMQEYHYRFDTVSIYNYILKCIDVCEKPINFFNRVELTDADLDEICKKIKHFTKKPTYNLSSEIRPLLVDCSIYYDNYLEFEWWEDIKTEDLEKEIIGNINIYIAIKLGDIIFKIIEEEVLKLPIFNSNKSNNISYDIVGLLKEKLSEDVFISRRFFPYRKNKPILNLPKFSFRLNDNADKTLERLKKYKHKIEQM
jgi:hypothetical protein